jgi:4-methyl-5(b-hydroxyethyl)-thiazole monophosphate biosynthesis
MAKKVLALLAEGFEEVEAVTPLDYLRRAGIDAAAVGVTGQGGAIKGSHGILVTPDFPLQGIDGADWDGILLPGGMPGASNIAASAPAGRLIKDMAAAGKLICAICASPAIILAPLGLLAGRRFTCFPGMEARVKDGVWSEDPVVTDGNVITSRGAGTAAVWAVAIIDALLGHGKGEKIARMVLL